MISLSCQTFVKNCDCRASTKSSTQLLIF